jgi:hypothetical protein
MYNHQLSQALVNNGKISQSLKQQIDSNTGNIINLIEVIRCIESGVKHSFMKPAARLKMFTDIEVYHHHVNWNIYENAIWYLKRNSEYLNIIQQLQLKKITLEKATQLIDPLLLKAVGMMAKNHTGQWLIYIKQDSLNYFIGIFRHSNDSLTFIKSEFDKRYFNLGISCNIRLTDAENQNRALADIDQEIVIKKNKKYIDELLKQQILDIINKEFPWLLNAQH